jgi:glycosyltransferase involved in cell wall biosynthesis
MRMFIRKAERIIVSSRVVAKHVEETYCVDRKRIEHLSPPVDTELYKPVCLSSEPLCAKEINRRKIEGRKKKILYVGGLSPSNRFPIIPVLTLIRRLVKDFPDLKLIIFSNRNYKNIKSAVALQKEAEKLDVLSNVQVEIKNLSDEAKSDLYRQADLFLFPSAPPYSATEPPIAPMEAMASGLPVVSTRIPSLEEFVVNNVNGLIYSLEDESYSDLTNRMSQLLKDGEMRTKFSIDARKTIVEKVSPTQTGKKLIKIYANI